MRRGFVRRWFVQRHRWALLSLACVCWAGASVADVDQCVEAHSHGQVLRDEGKLLESKTELLRCASDDTCPAPIKEECEQYLGAVQRLTPSLVFASRDHIGRDLEGVRIYMGNAVVDWVSGDAPIAVNPGPHLVRFEHPDGRVIEQKVDAVQGEKARLVVAEFSPNELLEERDEPVTLPTKEAQSGDVKQVMTYAFGGLAVIGLASFTILALQGKSEESDLRASCAPNCASAQKQSVAQKYLWADVSLAIAGLSLAGGAVLYLTPLGSDDTAASIAFTGEF